MIFLVVLAVVLAVLAPLPGSVLGPLVLLAGVGVVAFFIDCARWPSYFDIPALWSGRCR